MPDSERGTPVTTTRPAWVPEQLFPFESRTVILEGAEHYIQEEVPEEIVAAIKSWWSEEVQPTG